MSEAVNDVKDRRFGPNLQNRFKIPVEWRRNISCNDAINSYDYVASVIDEWVWGTGGITTTGVKRGTRKKNPFPGATLSTKNATWTVLRKNPDLRRDRPAPNPSCDTVRFLRRNSGQFLLRPVSLWDHSNVKQVTYAGMEKSQASGRPGGRISYGDN
jgi:hypothetical protein